ncbi:PT domain-containing protein [Arthrobacter sp. FW305-BF8]|uniref:PT domain-containing protein n=1 Tax=Arthrobacter sp. FW305-BF8 TaxID=2879617 RepID=UPI001F3B64B0|nr:PT domain-containing protein [Arthrobacter sp. FW305-BF8]UKA56616.1 PT domain-containing protein [Arthrobacter sp. FW305-BF8]
MAAMKAWLGKNRFTAIASGIVVVLAIVIASSVSATGSRSATSARPAVENEVQPTSAPSVSPTDSTGSQPPSPTSLNIPSPTPTSTLVMSGTGEFANGAIYSGSSPFLIPVGTVDTTALLAASGPGAQSAGQSAIFMEGKVQRLAALVEYQTEAVDLKPATVELRLNFYSEDLNRVTSTAKVASNPGTSYSGPNFTLIGSSTNVVVITDGLGTGVNLEATSSAYDSRTGNKLWTRPGTVQRTVHDVAISYQVTSKEDQQCYYFHGIKLGNGVNAWALDGTALEPDNPCGYATPSNLFWPDRYVGIDGSGTNIVIDGVTGKKMFWPDARRTTVLADPVSGKAFATAYDSDPAYVFDPHTGRRGFSVPAAQAAALELEVSGFFDGKLYAKNSTESLVLDATTGKALIHGWEVRPIATSGGLVLFSDGTFQPESVG